MVTTRDPVAIAASDEVIATMFDRCRLWWDEMGERGNDCRSRAKPCRDGILHRVHRWDGCGGAAEVAGTESEGVGKTSNCDRCRRNPHQGSLKTSKLPHRTATEQQESLGIMRQFGSCSRVRPQAQSLWVPLIFLRRCWKVATLDYATGVAENPMRIRK